MTETALTQVRDRVVKLLELIEEYADHQSVRCGWPAGYGQWKDGDCPCGLTRMLREAGLPAEWAGATEPSVDEQPGLAGPRTKENGDEEQTNPDSGSPRPGSGLRDC